MNMMDSAVHFMANEVHTSEAADVHDGKFSTPLEAPDAHNGICSTPVFANSVYLLRLLMYMMHNEF